MADKKITALTAATTTVSTDLLYLARSPFGVTDDRKITLATFFNNLTSAPIPASNDGVALGDATHGFADLFLASGGVLNWDNGNYTLTHSSGLLTTNGALAITGALSGVTTLTMSNNLTIYDATNDGNPEFVIGSSATENMTISAAYASGTQTLERIIFNTNTASGTANYGKYTFGVDGTDILDIDDDGVQLKSKQLIGVTNFTQLGSYQNGTEATGTAGFYASYSPVDTGGGTVNYNNRLVYTWSLTGDGTVVSYAATDIGTYIAGADGVNKFDYALITVNAGAHAGEKWTIIFRTDVVVTQANLETWLNQHTEVGTGNYTVESFFDAGATRNIEPGDTATSDYSYEIPGICNYYGGPNPGTIPGYLRYLSDGNNGTACGKIEVYGDVCGSNVLKYDPTSSEKELTLGSQNISVLIPNNTSLYFGDYVVSASYDPAGFGTGFGVFFIGGDKGTDDEQGALVAVFGGNGGDKTTAGNGTTGGVTVIFGGTGGKGEGAGVDGAYGDIIACYDAFTDSPTTAGNFFIGTNDVDGTPAIGRLVVAGSTNDGTTMSGRLLEKQGADVASANDLTLGSDGNTFEITGATQINAITTTGWQNGALVTLGFSGTPTVKYNTAGGAGTAKIYLAGAADFSATANDTLTLRLMEIGGT